MIRRSETGKATLVDRFSATGSMALDIAYLWGSETRITLLTCRFANPANVPPVDAPERVELVSGLEPKTSTSRGRDPRSVP
jgi:hypothetical protein